MDQIRWKLLLVEDDVDSAEALTALLDLHGIETLWAIDGPAALQALDAIHRLDQRPPDIVVLDVNLPNTDTVALGREMKDHLAGCPVVIASASSPHVLEEMAERIGAVDALRKPFSVDRLLAILSRDRSGDRVAVNQREAGRR